MPTNIIALPLMYLIRMSLFKKEALALIGVLTKVRWTVIESFTGQWMLISDFCWSTVICRGYSDAMNSM